MTGYQLAQFNLARAIAPLDSPALADFMARCGEWFVRMAGPYTVLWWDPAGHRPTIEEAVERLAHLERHGPTTEAFTFKQSFPAPEEVRARAV